MANNRGYKKILFSLIQSEICGKELDATLLQELSAEVLANLYEISNKHDVAHIVASALSKYKKLAQDAISQQYQKQLWTAIYRYQKINHELENICNALERSGVPFLPLKGSVIRDIYPQPWMRTSSDIDVLIHPEDAEKAIAVLEESGFTLQHAIATYDYQMFSDSGVHLELHHTLIKDESILHDEKILQNVWNECALVEGKQFHYHMSEEMFMFHHIEHMANHITVGGCGIRPFIDLWLLLNKKEYDHEKLTSLLSEGKLLDFYQAAVVLSKVWLEDAAHNDVTAQLEQYILRGGVYGTTENVAAMKAAKGESKFRSFVKLLYLSRENLEVVYPNLKEHPGLYPFYQVKRWFRIFNPKKRKRIGDMTAARNAVSADEEKQVKNLLLDLGFKE